MKPTDSRRSPEEYAAWAVDQVFREGRSMLPAGTLPASAMIPCLCIGVGGLTFFIAFGVSEAYRSAAMATAMIAPFVLMALPIALHTRVIWGRPRASRVLLIYIRVLLVCALGVVTVSALGLFTAPWWLGVVAVFGIGIPHEILRSWSYAAFTAFFALKRTFRAEQLAARDRILGRGTASRR